MLHAPAHFLSEIASFSYLNPKFVLQESGHSIALLDDRAEMDGAQRPIP
jgi:hypothetical protein